MPLRRLLIKIYGLAREFDGEQGFHAGVQVEGFTGPAGPNGAGVGMLEAVHRRQLIKLGLLPSPQRETKMPGQVVITDPGQAGLPVRFIEHPTITVTGDGDSALADGGVMPLANQDQIV